MLAFSPQRSNGSQLELLRVRVGDMLSQGGSGGEITGSLVDLRMTLNDINPNELSRPCILRTFDINSALCQQNYSSDEDPPEDRHQVRNLCPDR